MIGVPLNAARRDFLERETVAFAQATQLRAEEMSLAQQARHG